MFKFFTPQILAIGLLLGAVGAILGGAIVGEIELTPRWAVRASVLLTGLALWMGYGWWRDQERFWAWLGVGVGALAVSGVFWAVGWYGGAVTVIAAVAMGSCFVALLELIRLGLDMPLGVFGVARVLIHEVVRTHVAVAFCAMLFFWVALLPHVLDPGDPLRYRVQTFLTYSLSGASLLLTLMTVLVSCGTVCGDLEYRHIQLTLTKRVARAEYLLGKWVGIVLLNLALLAVTGAGIYTFTSSMRAMPAQDQYDSMAVDEQVLAARVAALPKPPEDLDLNAQYRDHLAKLRAENPDRYGSRLSPREQLSIRRAVLAKWHTIGPLSTGRYVFTGLAPAKQYGETIQLRLKPTSSIAPPEDRVRMAVWLNGRMFGPVEAVDRVYHVVNLPVDAIDKDGRLEVAIQNINLRNRAATFPSSISFTPDEGLEVLYQAGRFEWNLVRGLGMLWVRLGFIGMLGLGAGTFLGFPVACLMCLLVYFSSAASGFLLEALHSYASLGATDGSWWESIVAVPGEIVDKVSDGEYWAGCQVIIRLIGETFLALIPSLSEYNPVPAISDGRLIGVDLFWTMVWKVGLVWTSVCGAWSLYTLSRRELARVIV